MRKLKNSLSDVVVADMPGETRVLVSLLHSSFVLSSDIFNILLDGIEH